MEKVIFNMVKSFFLLKKYQKIKRNGIWKQEIYRAIVIFNEKQLFITFIIIKMIKIINMIKRAQNKKNNCLDKLGGSFFVFRTRKYVVQQ